METVEIARVFWTGRSQAVRLPVGFRLDAEHVRIARRGREIVLEPIHTDWAWLDALPGALDRDAISGAAEAVGEQKRAALDRIFK